MEGHTRYCGLDVIWWHERLIRPYLIGFRSQDVLFERLKLNAMVGNYLNNNNKHLLQNCTWVAGIGLSILHLWSHFILMVTLRNYGRFIMGGLMFGEVNDLLSMMQMVSGRAHNQGYQTLNHPQVTSMHASENDGLSMDVMSTQRVVRKLAKNKWLCFIMFPRNFFVALRIFVSLVILLLYVIKLETGTRG